ncbi:hypothetical protein C8R44DRAFT_874742 [Mycena epipterygia]|nr:hypothetical protein C8R44DRAFT_874742 [Mycena epipterygia]
MPSDLSSDDKGLAPSLVAAKEKLQRSQLEAPIPLTTVSPADCAPKDQLANAIAARPPREELEKSGPEEEQAPASA